jgi:hypothetical protein
MCIRDSLAPVLSGIVIASDDKAGVFQFLRINLGSEFGQLRAVETGHKERFNLGHVRVIPQTAGKRETLPRGRIRLRSTPFAQPGTANLFE